MPEHISVNTRHYLTYLGMILVFGVGIWVVLALGTRQHPQPDAPLATVESAEPTDSSTRGSSVRIFLKSVLSKSVRGSLAVLLLQLIVIITAARVFGALAKYIGQPRVMGEIVAGIVLGPSVLGSISALTMEILFPAASLEPLRLLSQIGVALFMFVVGMELDIAHLRKKAHAAIMISHASIIVPFFLGSALALLVYGPLAPGEISFIPFALFLGIAMSITAFPVLARIIEDRGLSQTPLATIAFTCAAIGDITAWSILPLVIAIAQASSLAASLLTVALTLAFIGGMMLLVRPLLAWLLPAHPNITQRSPTFVAGTLVFVFASALVTEAIGIHALFGAFLAGVVMPSAASLRGLLKEKLGSFSAAALLPLFFAFTGLRLQVGLLNDWQSWAICALIVLVANAGKLGASMLMARWTGMNWRGSFALGALMNTRGLVELVVLNIGYDLGILSARAFALLVLMALVTTFMTGPLLSLARRRNAD